MTTWPDENGEADDFEFYDPTAVTSETGEQTASDTAPAPARSSGEESEEGGVSDPTGSVQLWFDDDRRVTQVRVSNRWRERLGKQTLDEVLLALLKSSQAKAGGPVWQDSRGAEPAATALSAEALERLVEQTSLLDAEARDLGARDDVVPTRYAGQGAQGASENTMVAVEIDLHARTTKVTVNPKWVANAKTVDIRDAILQAHQAAYAGWTPPEVVPGDWDKLNAKRSEITHEIMAMFRHGI